MHKRRQSTLRSIAVVGLLGMGTVSCSSARYSMVPDDELPLLAPCTVRVEGKEPCAAYLKTTDGRRLLVGGPGASPVVTGFVQFLQEGQVYVLPDAFVEYQRDR